MKSFDDATNQVAGLMAAVGGNVDAYEDESSSTKVASNFEAANASVEAHIQHNEPTVGSQEHIKQVTEQTTGKTEAELLREMASLSEQLGGLTTNPLEEKTEYIEETLEDYPSASDEDEWTAQELSFFKEENVDPDVAAEPIDGSVEVEDADEPFGAKFFDCLTDMYILENAPPSVEGCYELLGDSISYGELYEIYTSFKFAQKTGELQTVTLDNGLFEMTPNYGGGVDMTLHDTVKGRKYVQQSSHSPHDGEGYENVKEGDLFIWVISDDQEEDLGYIHNQWVFLRKKE
jgi:hypothetical protein